MKETIGKRISSARRELSLTQEGLAEAMGVSTQAVSKWENDISCPDISLIPKLARTLGMTTDELLSGNVEYKEIYDSQMEATKQQQLVQKEIRDGEVNA